MSRTVLNGTYSADLNKRVTNVSEKPLHADERQAYIVRSDTLIHRIEPVSHNGVTSKRNQPNPTEYSPNRKPGANE